VLNGDLRLLAHERQDLIVRARFDTAGVHQTEFAAAPLALAVDAVARDARRILDDGEPLAMRLLNSMDLPTFGRPTIATKGFISLPPLFQSGARSHRSLSQSKILPLRNLENSVILYL